MSCVLFLTNDDKNKISAFQIHAVNLFFKPLIDSNALKSNSWQLINRFFVNASSYCQYSNSTDYDCVCVCEYVFFGNDIDLFQFRSLKASVDNNLDKPFHMRASLSLRVCVLHKFNIYQAFWSMCILRVKQWRTLELCWK